MKPMAVAFLLTLFTSCQLIDGRNDEAAVSLRFVITAQDSSFTGGHLDARLYRYDPNIADVAADLVDRVVLRELSHQKGTETRFTTALSTAIVEGRRYYVTARLYLDASLSVESRLYFADGFNAVLGTNQDQELTMVLTRFR